MKILRDIHTVVSSIIILHRSDPLHMPPLFVCFSCHCPICHYRPHPPGLDLLLLDLGQLQPWLVHVDHMEPSGTCVVGKEDPRAHRRTAAMHLHISRCGRGRSVEQFRLIQLCESGFESMHLPIQREVICSPDVARRSTHLILFGRWIGL